MKKIVLFIIVIALAVLFYPKEYSPSFSSRAVPFPGPNGSLPETSDFEKKGCIGFSRKAADSETRAYCYGLPL